ncbi:MAG: hypothetical protein M1828_005243 [Chrysothrix sp. TS-e1954]|nr:MAG: hypothetical protein M1828_005243 [Chrysothrix sp. TS-e1954]
MPAHPSHTGILHRYTSRLVAFEHQTPRPDAKPQPYSTYAAAAAAVSQKKDPVPQATNFILFIAGLGDSLLTVTYPALLASLLPRGWAIIEVSQSSAGTGWTLSSLQQDADELARAVAYFRELGHSRLGDDKAAQRQTKLILMGHSTGCQVSMEYLVGPYKHHEIPESTLARPKVDGVILQAAVSDREGASKELSSEVLENSLRIAKDMIADGRGEDILPLSATGGEAIFGAQPCARRWVSLIDPDGDDDYFSNPEETGYERAARIWGEAGLASRDIPVMVLWSRNDQFVPEDVNKEERLERFRICAASAPWDQRSGVVEGAGHSLNGSAQGPRHDLCQRVTGFVERIGDIQVSDEEKDSGEDELDDKGWFRKKEGEKL